jgi:anaerobic selenocysteine-containing dehydrogenase
VSAPETNTHVLPSTCWECSTTCGALLHVRDGRVVSVGPNPQHPSSAGAFCAKGVRALPQWTYGEERLLHPLRRSGPRGSGQWQRIGFAEAIEQVAEAFARVHRRHGALALAGVTSGAFFSRGAVMALMMRALGSPNWLINQDLCGGCRGVSDRVTGLAITGNEDIARARCALLVGRNPYAADPVQWRALKALKARGGQMVVIDPNATPAARMADLWLAPRPGTDAALALAMIHVLVSEDRHDHAFVQRWCNGFDALARRAAEYPPTEAERLTGVPARRIEEAARRYADGPSVFLSGHGIDAFSAGFQTFRAFHCLVAISGNVDVPGGNLVVKKPAGVRTYLDLIHDPDFALPADVASRAIGAQRYPLWTGPEGWQGACHNPSVIDAVLHGDPYPVRGMLISGVNIAVTYPDTRRTVAALRALDFLAVATHEMTPTAAWADIVLPKTTTLEEEEVQVQPRGACVSFTQPAHPPLGEARPDIGIASALLDRLATRIPVQRRFLPWTGQRELNEFLLGDSGIDIDTLRREGFVRFQASVGDFEAQGFRTPSGKVELFASRLAELGVDPLPGFVPPAVGKLSAQQRDDYPLLLLTGEREKNYHHSRFRNQAWLRQRSPDPVLRMHPATAAALRLEADQWVGIETLRGPGRASARLAVTDRVPPGVVSTGMGWWRPEAPAPWFGALEVNINAALSYSGPHDPVTGSADSRGVPCRIIAAPA